MSFSVAGVGARDLSRAWTSTTRGQRLIQQQDLRVWFELWTGQHLHSQLVSIHSEARRGEPEGWPRERFQTALAWAYFGGIEAGDNFFNDAEGLSREAILEIFREMLSDEEMVAVETVAVPQRIRAQSGAALEQLMRTGSFEDRVYSLIWMTLTGWRDSSESTIPTRYIDFLVDIEETYLSEVCTDDKLLAEASERISMAKSLHTFCGPPPLAISGPTLGAPRPGWRTITYMVPDELVEGSDSNGAALDPLAST